MTKAGLPSFRKLSILEKSGYYQHQAKISSIVEASSAHARRIMFERFMNSLSPDRESRVLDVGVTCDRRSDSNFFEKYYEHKDRITAVGLEDASFLEQDFPGLQFIKADAMELPFRDKEFDIAVSWAVIEHVGSRQRQKRFLSELLRVSKRSFITTPNRWYPIEFHTVMPFLHWLPPETFRGILKTLGMNFFASEENLNLLDEKSLLDLLPAKTRVEKLHLRLLGPISHLVLSMES